MNRVLRVVPCGILFGAIDASVVLFGESREKSTTVLLPAFFSRFVMGILAARVTFRLHPALSGVVRVC